MDSPITVLVVDDDPTIRFLVRTVLELEGVDFVVVGEAEDGDVALERLRELRDESQPSVIVLDIMMPTTDGLTVAREVKREQPDQHIVLFSAYLNGDVREEARQIGVDACMTKTDVEELPNLLRQLLEPAERS